MSIASSNISVIGENIGILLILAAGLCVVLRAWKWAGRLAALAFVATFVSVYGPAWVP